VAAALAIEGLSFLATWFLYDPRHPYLQLAWAAPYALGAIIIFALMEAMVGDICDLDELETGMRREGMFSALTALILKGSIAAAIVLGGYLIKLAGVVEGVARSPRLAGAVEKVALQSPRTLLILRLEFIALPVVLLAVAGVCLWLYPVNETQVKQAREILNQQGKQLLEACAKV
jgi:GPH family glycoside/pentoside/hexuronide:cation symporter